MSQRVQAPGGDPLQQQVSGGGGLRGPGHDRPPRGIGGRLVEIGVAAAATDDVDSRRPPTGELVDGPHDCAGLNECKGLGGCKSGDNGCAAKNSCKGKGGCAVPVKEA